jgi:quercetin dioxygenase-like cupin family protein
MDKAPLLPKPLVEAIAEALVPSMHLAATERVRNRLRDRMCGDARSTDRTAAAATAATPTSVQGFLTLAGSGAEGWVEMLPKAHAKLLFTDGNSESYLIRLEPGAWAPAHDHPADEECLVIEGSLWQGDIYLKAGDFHVARPGVRHGDLRTETGALVFIRYGRPLAEYLRM